MLEIITLHGKLYPYDAYIFCVLIIWGETTF
jgi:hypothetical protein